MFFTPPWHCEGMDSFESSTSHSSISNVIKHLRNFVHLVLQLVPGTSGPHPGQSQLSHTQPQPLISNLQDCIRIPHSAKPISSIWWFSMGRPSIPVAGSGDVSTIGSTFVSCSFPNISSLLTYTLSTSQAPRGALSFEKIWRICLAKGQFHVSHGKPDQWQCKALWSTGRIPSATKTTKEEKKTAATMSISKTITSGRPKALSNEKRIKRFESRGETPIFVKVLGLCFIMSCCFIFSAISGPTKLEEGKSYILQRNTKYSTRSLVTRFVPISDGLSLVPTRPMLKKCSFTPLIAPRVFEGLCALYAWAAKKCPLSSIADAKLKLHLQFWANRKWKTMLHQHTPSQQSPAAE